MKSPVTLEPIAFIESCYPDKFGTPRQPGLVPQSWARIRIERKWHPAEALQGLEEFTHLWLIFLFHQNENTRYHAKVHPPRMGGKSIGVFATRSPHRPNPIGLSLVKIESINEIEIVVSGVDLVDGTPILDVKPYLPDIESRPQASAGWTGSVIVSDISILWTEELLKQVQNWSEKESRLAGASPDRLRQLIEETLRLDPRPLVYRDREMKDHHAVRLFDGDVHFRFQSPQEIQILRVLF